MATKKKLIKLIVTCPTESNCLADMRCPRCGGYGPFYIGTQCITLVHDDGTETDFGDTDSYCKCYECKHAGTVGDFTEKVV